jgi:hypothetical protein
MVARLSNWEHGGIAYSVHIGRAMHLRGRMVVMAVGPAREYRAVVLGPEAADEVLATIVLTPDPRRRTEAAECLLALGNHLLN